MDDIQKIIPITMMKKNLQPKLRVLVQDICSFSHFYALFDIRCQIFGFSMSDIRFPAFLTRNQRQFS